MLLINPPLQCHVKSLLSMAYSNTPSEIEAATKRQHFGEELTSWLFAEMAENRDNKKVKAKVRHCTS